MDNNSIKERASTNNMEIWRANFILNDTMRIACLLPSATDICIELGLADFIVGVTHECNIELLQKNQSKNGSSFHILTESGLQRKEDGSELSQAEIDEQVKQASLADKNRTDGISINSIYPIVEETFMFAKPTIVFTQNLCSVCAPSVHDVETLVTGKEGGERREEIKIVSLDPHSLEDVAETFLTIAKVCGVEERGQRMKEEFLANIQTIGQTINNFFNSDIIQKKTVLLLEWIDPPYDAGHWIPEMIEAAGCTALRIKPTTKSKRISWDDIYATDPDVVLVACCGFNLKRNVDDALKSSSKLERLRAAQNNRIYACNGDMYCTRPGPRLLQGICTIARCVYDGQNDIIQAMEKLNFFSKSSLEWEKVPILFHKDIDVMDIEDSANTVHDFNALHDDACAAGEMTYIDPESGYKVFTEIAHKKRGKCCGAGCRHCPFNHENVKDKAARIKQPALLFNGCDENDITGVSTINLSDIDVKVLFFSGGKDSFLTIRALMKLYKQSKKKLHLILLTTFDATSRIIAHQEIHIDTVIQQASHLNIPLIGVPVIRASAESYVSRIDRALDLLAKYVNGRSNIKSLVFGDLHLEHIRSWRENELRQLGHELEYPLWKMDFDYLKEDLKDSGVECVISNSTVNKIAVGEVFNDDFMEKIHQLEGIDLFGENGEFHSCAKVWVSPRNQALGIE